ncbi:Zinc phosphodiesterase ELAC protein 1, partial [Ophiophagus hannah]
MSLDITFLGTGAAYPSPTRGASATVIRFEGECWLFDCGEGTQTQFMKSNLKAGELQRFLQCSPDANKLPVDIYGPLGLKDFLQRAMALSCSQLVFPYVVHELVPTPSQCPEEEWNNVFSGKRDEVSCSEPQGDMIYLNPADDSYFLVDSGPVVLKAFRLFHRIPSFGFLNPFPGRKICVLGDCSGVVGDGVTSLCSEADILIHEATLDDSQMEKAKERGHSTPKMAAEFAKLCKARKLVLCHFSQRYKPANQIGEGDADVTELKKQAEMVLNGQEVVLAEDFMTISIPVKKPK